MIDYKKYKRVVAYGCSYTAGDELRDHEILGLSLDECRRQKLNLGYDKFNAKIHPSGVTYTTLLNKSARLNRHSCWAAHFAKNLKMNFENHARGGSSIDEILFKLLQTLENGSVTKDDLIIVGLTSPNRFLKWPKDEYPASRVLGLTTMGIIPKDVQKWNLENIWTDNNLIFKYIQTVNTMLNLSENIYVQYIRPVCNPMSPEYNTMDIVKYFYESVIDQDRFLHKKLYLEMGDMHCGFGHPPLSSHIKFGEKLAKIAKGENID